LVEGIKPGEFGVPRPPAETMTSPTANPALALQSMKKPGGNNGSDPNDVTGSKSASEKFAGTALSIAQPEPVPPLPLESLVSSQDREQPETLVAKLLTAALQTTPPRELITKFSAVLAAKARPIDDTAIRELISLMLATPNCQLC
jgi:hypothetical protein